MALFGNCFPCRHAVIAACYRDEYATNFNLASGCKYKVFAASTPQLLKNLRSIRFDGGTSQRRGGIEQKGGRRASWCKDKKRVQVLLPQKRDTGKNVPRYYLSWQSWLATLTLVDPREQ